MTATATKTRKKEFAFPTLENLALRRGRKELLTLQQKITRLHFKMGFEIAKLKAAVPVEKLPGALVADCRVPAELVEMYLGMADHLGDHEQLLSSQAVPVSVLKDLVEADQRSRAASLRRVASDCLVSTGETTATARDAAMSREKLAALARKRYLGRIASSRTVRPAVEAFESSVMQFSKVLNEFRKLDLRIMDTSFTGYRRTVNSDAAYLAGHEAVRLAAKSVRHEFERIYGGSHVAQENWREIARRRPEAVKLAMAHKALVRLAEGLFGHEVGFSLDENSTSLWTNDLINALQYLSSENLRGPGAPHYAEPRKAPLRALEVCAGVGGQALGLQRAGFELTALYEKDKASASAAKASRPKWNVIQADIQKDPEALFRQYAGRIDVLSGGLPCQPYTGRGDGNGQFDKRDLFPTAVTIVRTVRPLAFFFENVEGFTFFKHQSHRAKIFSDFSSLGYKVWMPTINSGRYGVPQDRERVLVIGIRKNIAHRFQIPDPPTGTLATMGTTIQDLLFPHRTKKHQICAPSSLQGIYDDWAEWWLREYGDRQAPTLTKLGGSKEFVTSWTAAGLDARIAERPPTLGEVQVGFLPRPTVPILKRLQGLPDNWHLAKARSTKLQQLANAFPPHAARAIGLALRQAISGDTIHMQRELLRPIVPVTPNLNQTSDDLPPWEDYYLEEGPDAAGP